MSDEDFLSWLKKVIMDESDTLCTEGYVTLALLLHQQTANKLKVVWIVQCFQQELKQYLIISNMYPQ